MHATISTRASVLDGEKMTTETAYYLLSTALTRQRLEEVARHHWGVENSPHRQKCECPALH